MGNKHSSNQSSVVSSPGDSSRSTACPLHHDNRSNGLYSSVDHSTNSRPKIKARKAKYSPEFTLTLSPVTIKKIQSVWKDAVTEGNDEPGATILRAVMFKAPEVRYIFNFSYQSLMAEEANEYAEDTNVDEIGDFEDPLLTDHPAHESVKAQKVHREFVGFEVHAKRFTEVMNRVVVNLDCLDPETSNYLVELGKAHFFAHEYGFTPKLWQIFSEAMITKSIEWGTSLHSNDTKLYDAWSKIVIYIVGKMKQGYYQELRTASPIWKTPDA